MNSHHLIANTSNAVWVSRFAEFLFQELDVAHKDTVADVTSDDGTTPANTSGNTECYGMDDDKCYDMDDNDVVDALLPVEEQTDRLN